MKKNLLDRILYYLGFNRPNVTMSDRAIKYFRSIDDKFDL